MASSKSNSNNRRARQGDIDGVRGMQAGFERLGFSGTSRSAIDQDCPGWGGARGGRSRLLPRACRSYKQPPVTKLGTGTLPRRDD
jgi:hypothetical protein